MSRSDVVIGLDSSTQSVKAIAWDRQGRAVGEGRAPLGLANPRPGWYEQDPEEWWGAAVGALRGLLDQVEARRIAGLAIANQRETVAFLDAAGRPVRPAITWIDERSRAVLSTVSRDLGAEWLHRTTGKPVDVTPVLYSLAWLKTFEPEAFARTARFLDVQGYLVGRLSGSPRTSWTSADPWALFDIEARTWSRPILDYLGLDETRLAEAHRPGTRLGVVSGEAAAAIGLPQGLPIFAAGGDGQSSGLGTGTTAPGQAYMNLGTALVSGVWSAHPAVSRYWRTMISATGEGYILEAVQRTGAFLVNWLADTFAGGKGDPAVFDRLEVAARDLPIGADGLLVLPYWSGCMNPHWDPDARGCLIGLTPAHGLGHVYRAVLEGLTLETLRAHEAMAEAGVPVERIVVIGGGAKSRLWTQMVADASGREVAVQDTVEATALGAGMTAAFGAGWYGSIREAAEGMGGARCVVRPEAGRVERYRELMDIQGRLYSANAEIFAALARRAAG
ncbi:MAG: FGGY-family carbohydrate kinase [Rhodospirillaceae bacterium]|nr:FGGY-family carbohydrate kinase [Rhodospirillaceae bacterium]